MRKEVNKNILITGANGFVGKHLINFLLKKKYNVSTLGTKPLKSTNFFKLELPINYPNIENTISLIKPRYIFHLAGSNPNAGLKECFQINTIFGIYILESIEKLNFDGMTKILLLGSAAEYGLVAEKNLPIMETSIAKPITPYGISKLSMTYSALNWHNQHRHVTVVRPFSILGSNMPVHMALGNFFHQISHLESNEINVGNLKTKRDFIDIRDFIDCIYKLIKENKSSGQIINVCSNKPTSIKEILNFYIENKNRKVSLKFNKNLTRKNDMDVNFGSNEKLKSIINISNLKNWQKSVLEIIKTENFS